MGFAAPLASRCSRLTRRNYRSRRTASNLNFIGSPGGFSGPYLNGLSLLAPNYQTPRTVQINAGCVTNCAQG